MDSFARKLITEWRSLGLPTSDAAFILGVSGGADSIALLFAIHELISLGKLNIRLVAAHFNHRLRGDESERDESFVRDVAGRLGVELAVGAPDGPLEGNVEQAGRDARYAFLARVATGVGSAHILTAHTMSDQAETFLLNLIRGSGPAGLGGMRPVRSLAAGIELVRPLLSWSKRVDTENYCRIRDLEFRYDSMNEDLGFARVRVRKLLLPMLAEFNPNIIGTLANTANLMRADLEEREPETSDRLRIADLERLPKPELYAVIRSWLGQRRGNLRSLELKHIQAIDRLIFSGKSGRIAELPGGGRVVKRGGWLRYENIQVDK